MRLHLFLIFFSLILGIALGAMPQLSFEAIQKSIAQIYFGRGKQALLVGDLEAALGNFDLAIQLNDKYVGAFINRGNVRADLGDVKGALRDYDIAIEIEPSNHIAYANRGSVYSKTGRYEEALLDFTISIKGNPEFAPAYVGRGLSLDELGDVDGALHDYNYAIKLDSKDAIAYHNRGGVRARLGDLKGALDDFNEAIRLDPKDGIAHFNRGFNRAAIGEKSAAIRDYDKAIELDREHEPSFRYHRALVELDLGKRDVARQDLIWVVSVDPTFVLARKKLDIEFPRAPRMRTLRMEGIPHKRSTAQPQLSHCYSMASQILAIPLAGILFVGVSLRTGVIYKPILRGLIRVLKWPGSVR